MVRHPTPPPCPIDEFGGNDTRRIVRGPVQQASGLIIAGLDPSGGAGLLAQHAGLWGAVPTHRLTGLHARLQVTHPGGMLPALGRERGAGGGELLAGVLSPGAAELGLRALRLDGLFLIDRFFGLFDKRQHVAHAERLQPVGGGP